MDKWPSDKMQEWLHQAAAMAKTVILATANDRLRPHSAVTAIKAVDSNGIELELTEESSQPAALCVYIMDAGRQIRVEGIIAGNKLKPEAIEFWQEKPFRLHDRTRYEHNSGEWKSVKLYP